MLTESREKQLQNEIVKYKKAYYDGEPLISDAAYDQMEEELRDLNPNNPALFLVGTPIGGKIKHDPPMLSCKKATNIDEVIKWFNESHGADLFFGFKIDGLSLSLIYQDGNLIQGATRGNGIAGDDVTFAACNIEDIPKKIPVKGIINVRGEVYMPLSEFNRLKAILLDISSPRNFAAGTIKQKDPSIVRERKLNFMAWGLEGYNDDLSFEESNALLRSWKFNTADIHLLTNVDRVKIEAAFQEVVDKRDSLDFELDGVVFKYNDALDRKRVGSTEHHPKWQIALKFKSQGALTKVKEITWQVGRTGVLTPVAIVKPITIAGASITRATLHNAEFVEKMNLAPGDRVYIERSGDVIPKIIEVVEKGSNPTSLITNCPSCNSKLERVSVNLICTGQKCKDRDLRNIEHWIQTTEIKGLGLKNLEKLFDDGIVTHFSDLYSDQLTEEKLVEVLGVIGKRIYKYIQNTRQLPFHIYLSSLGIPQLGKKLAKDLAKHFQDLQSLQNASISQLVELEGISDLTASYILEGINNPDVTDRILMHNFSLIYQKFDDDNSQKQGKIYVTGKVEGMDKKQVQKVVESLGFEWSTSISKNLTYLVTGKNPGGSKIDKALLNGIPILTWSEFNEKFGH